MVKRNSTTSAIKTTTAKYGEDFDSLIGIYLNNHDRKNQASGRSPNSKGSQSYSASSSSNSILYNQTQMSELIVKQLNEKDSTLMKALRLVNDQRQRTGNSSGPYSYIPVIMGQAYDHYGQQYLPWAELGMILLVMAMWFASLWCCWQKFNRIRVLEPIVPPFPNIKSPMEGIQIVDNEGEAVIYQKVHINKHMAHSLHAHQNVNYIITTEQNLSEAQRNGQLADFIIAQKPSLRNRSASMSTTFSAMQRRKSSYVHKIDYMHKSFCGPSPYTVSRNGSGGLDGHSSYARRQWHAGTKSAIEFNKALKMFKSNNSNSSGLKKLNSSNNSVGLNYNNVKRSANFQTANKGAVGYRRVLDRRNLFARSKHFIKRVNVNPSGTLDEESNMLKTNSFSVKRSGEDSSTSFNNSRESQIIRDNSLKEKNVSFSISVKKSEDYSSPFESNSSRDKRNSKELSDFLNSMSGHNSLEIGGILKKNNSVAMASVDVQSQPKSPDLLDPNWIPERVKVNLLDLHDHVVKNKVLLQLSYISKSDSNLTGHKADKKQLSLQSSNELKDFEEAEKNNDN